MLINSIRHYNTDLLTTRNASLIESRVNMRKEEEEEEEEQQQQQETLLQSILHSETHK